MSWKVLKEKSDPFFVSDKNELIKEAYIGTISPMDLIQETETKQWFYAYELNELQFQTTTHSSANQIPQKRRTWIVPIFFFLMGALMLFVAGYYYQRTLAQEDLGFFTDLQENQGIISSSTAQLRSEISDNPHISSLPKNEIVFIKKKYKENYLISHPTLSKPMWINETQIIPLYLFTESERKQEWDLFFNTHTHLQVHNLSWSNPPKWKPFTAFFLQLQNTSPRFVHNIELAITLQNPDTQLKQTSIIQIVGNIAPANSVSIGTLWNPKTQEMQYTTESQYKEMQQRGEIREQQWIPSVNLDVQANFSEIVVQAVFAEIQN